MNVIIPIGGTGRRFSEEGYSVPKPLVRSLGKPIIYWNVENLKLSEDDTVYIVYREEFKIFNFEDLLSNRFRNVNFKFISIKNDTRGAAETVLYALMEMSNVEISDLTIIVDSDNFYSDDILSISKEKNSNLIFYKKDYEQKPIYSYLDLKGDKVIDIKEKEKISDNACVGAYCFKSGEILKETIREVLISEKKQKNEFYISTLYKFLIDKNVEVTSYEIGDFNCLGTPNQLKSFSSSFNISDDKYRFCFDLDNTLVSYPEVEGDYTTVKPINRTINYLKFLKSQGHTIIIYTARRMRTHSGNVGKVQADIAKITLETLDKFEIEYDEIYFGKPYAHFYIDDLAVKSFDDIEKETGFYNIHPKTRSHNKIDIFENYIIKYSTSIEGERYYYQNIPQEIKSLFPELISSGIDFIQLNKVQGIPFSFLNINNTLNENLLNNLFNKIHEIHSLNHSEEIDIYCNYYDKVNSRIKNFDFSNYDNFLDVKKSILEFLKEYQNENRGKIGVIHGDPVFTNILIDNKNNIKMIDMRGRVGDVLTICGDIFYDWAKVYQSLIGYDHILMDREIIASQIEKNIEIFENFIISKYNKEKLNDIKWITKSLILSLIPIHNNSKCLEYYKLINKI